MYLKIFIGIILLVLGYLKLKRMRMESKEWRADLLKVFDSATISLPTLEYGSSYYQWPTFKVTFKSKEDLEFAKRNKLTDRFKACVQSYYNSDFEVDRAVHFTYEGHKYF